MPEQLAEESKGPKGYQSVVFPMIREISLSAVSSVLLMRPTNAVTSAGWSSPVPRTAACAKCCRSSSDVREVCRCQWVCRRIIVLKAGLS